MKQHVQVDMDVETYLLDYQQEKTKNAAEVIFNDNLFTAQRYAKRLATSGIERGLLGPREVPRLWDRHILNCAIIHECISKGSSVLDVGSGAGLPGLALAIARPDLKVSLVESNKRRVNWLEETVDDLSLRNVKIFPRRAEEIKGRLYADVVTARAVASLEKLIKISFPLLRKEDGEDPNGDPGMDKRSKLIAIKGISVVEEFKAAQKLLVEKDLKACMRILGEDVLSIPTRIVEIFK